MKINRLDAHDRLQHLLASEDQINKGVQDCIKNRPDEFGTHPFYIFAHKRTIAMDERIATYQTDFHDHLTYGTPQRYKTFDEVPSHRMLWQPRLSKPLAQTNSMLFRIDPKREGIEICWILPDDEMFDAYEKGKMTEQEIVQYSIHLYKTDRKRLEQPFPDDVDEATGAAIYKAIAINAQKKAKKPLILPLKA
jgi:hypothetical protein